MRVRDNAESVAFYSGERSEWVRGIGSLFAVIENQYRVVHVDSVVESGSVVFKSFSSLTPYLPL